MTSDRDDLFVGDFYVSLECFRVSECMALEGMPVDSSTIKSLTEVSCARGKKLFRTIPVQVHSYGAGALGRDRLLTKLSFSVRRMFRLAIQAVLLPFANRHIHEPVKGM